MKQTLYDMARELGQAENLGDPGQLIGNDDDLWSQFLQQAHRAGELLLNYDWQFLKREVTSYTTVADERQFSLIDDAGPMDSSFVRICNSTFWDLTRKLQVWGPASDQDWQFLRAFVGSRAVFYYKIFDNVMHFRPAPPAGHSLTWLWICNKYVSRTVDGNEVRDSRFASDSDTVLFQDELFKLAWLRCWREVKGFDWKTLQAELDAKAIKLIAADSTKPDLPFDSYGFMGMSPGILVAGIPTS